MKLASVILRIQPGPAVTYRVVHKLLVGKTIMDLSPREDRTAPSMRVVRRRFARMAAFRADMIDQSGDGYLTLWCPGESISYKILEGN